MKQHRMTLIEAAATVGYSYNRVLRLVLIGQLKGERKDGRWFVDCSDVERLLGEIQAASSPGLACQ